jgi:hypothetical protein
MSSTTKRKKSFTLSPSSIVFLERLKRERKGDSVSLILDELIRQAEARRRQRTTEEAISAFYDSLSEEERKEEAAWGEFVRNRWKEEGS